MYVYMCENPKIDPNVFDWILSTEMPRLGMLDLYNIEGNKPN